MRKKLTISIDEAIYDALQRVIGRGNISRHIENLLKQSLQGNEMEEGYRAMAQDSERESEAQEWSNALMGDIDETR